MYVKIHTEIVVKKYFKYAKAFRCVFKYTTVLGYIFKYICIYMLYLSHPI